MNGYIVKSAAVLSILALTACGGGGSSSGGGKSPAGGDSPPGGETAPTGGGDSSSGGETAPTDGGNGTKGPSYNSLLAQFEDFRGRYLLDDPTAYDNLTAPAETPVSGKATYKGTGGYRLASTPEGTPPPIIGEALMNADFGKGTVSGSVTNLKASPGNRTSGGIIRMEAIIDKDAVVQGAINGNLDLNGETHRFSNPALGVFYGSDAEALAVVSAGQNWAGEDYVTVLTGETP
ncbi:transferrin-binding protein-like solute binding protein [Paracoccus methylarcula]|uniref:Transferrin-binding protein B C-lobe/N-lobe beta-barrel domain-containing protein n=1 Tax=Paracoccus methylarcula TaxID=72022 RepID=A0A422QTW3_9RHOB|nr:transferrin-binding protein-like solute binding protein [Paracoccus methylarcula]RNF33443.1 hypothetical protein A7A09_017015 [Paracoccus methylarcula]